MICFNYNQTRKSDVYYKIIVDLLSKWLCRNYHHALDQLLIAHFKQIVTVAFRYSSNSIKLVILVRVVPLQYVSTCLTDIITDFPHWPSESVYSEHNISRLVSVHNLKKKTKHFEVRNTNARCCIHTWNGTLVHWSRCSCWWNQDECLRYTYFATRLNKSRMFLSSLMKCPPSFTVWYIMGTNVREEIYSEH